MSDLDTIEQALDGAGRWAASIDEPSAAVESGMREALAALARIRAALEAKDEAVEYQMPVHELVERHQVCERELAVERAGRERAEGVLDYIVAEAWPYMRAATDSDQPWRVEMAEGVLDRMTAARAALSQEGTQE